MPDGQEGGDRIEEAVRAVLGSMAGDMTVTEVALLGELEALGREVARAKSEIAALRVDDINASHIPTATDELDAVVSHTANATNEILDCCEILEGLQTRLAGPDAATLSDAVTRIYEACSFQDITGQRIRNVVSTLRVIETKIDSIMNTLGDKVGLKTSDGHYEKVISIHDDKSLLNGPQMPDKAITQDDIDRLLAEFDGK